MNLTCASFFAGVGGIDFAFKQAGFHIVYANEFDKFAAKTFKQNHNTLLDTKSIVEVQEKDIPDFDILLAGFPCQAFSIAGKQKGFEDKGRGDLFFELERIFLHKKPQIIFLENVKNLISHDKGRTFSIIKNSLEKAGYFIKYAILNASEYGNLPQNRERIYIICFKNKEDYENFSFPMPIKLTKTIKDLLEKEVKDKYVYSDKTSFYPLLVEAMNSEDTLYQWRRKYVRENKSNLCPTLTANMGTGGHNVPLLKQKEIIRKLTPLECFRFQGFPSSFSLPSDMADCHLYKQAGNSVCVPVIFNIAKQIKKTLEQRNFD